MSFLADRMSGLEASQAHTVRTQALLIQELTAGANHFEVIDLSPSRQRVTIGSSPLQSAKAFTIINVSPIQVFLLLTGISFVIDRGSYLTLPVQTNQFEVAGSAGDLQSLSTQFGRPATVIVLAHKQAIPAGGGVWRGGTQPFRFGDQQGSAPLSVTVGAASTAVAAQNPVRHRLILVNDSSNVIYVNPFGGAAVVGQGIRLNAGGGVFDDEGGTTSAVNAIATIAGSNLCVSEWSSGAAPAVV